MIPPLHLAHPSARSTRLAPRYASCLADYSARLRSAPVLSSGPQHLKEAPTPSIDSAGGSSAASLGGLQAAPATEAPRSHGSAPPQIHATAQEDTTPLAQTHPLQGGGAPQSSDDAPSFSTLAGRFNRSAVDTSPPDCPMQRSACCSVRVQLPLSTPSCSQIWPSPPRRSPLASRLNPCHTSMVLCQMLSQKRCKVHRFALDSGGFVVGTMYVVRVKATGPDAASVHGDAVYTRTGVVQ
jgi:hypothetical protein